MAIKFPVTMPAATATDVVQAAFKYQFDGQAEVHVVETVAGGAFDLVVPEGSAFEYWCTMTDRAGNESGDSARGRVESAADTTPPPSPADAPSLGAGESVPD